MWASLFVSALTVENVRGAWSACTHIGADAVNDRFNPLF